MIFAAGAVMVAVSSRSPLRAAAAEGLGFAVLLDALLERLVPDVRFGH